MAASSKPSRMANLALVAVSIIVSLLLLELAYRAYLAVRDPLAPATFSWWLTPAPDGQFDAEMGQRFLPETSTHASIVRNGVVVACLGTVYATNIDGLAGATTLGEYANADLKVVLTGDSFSRWRLGGLTIADFLQGRLAEATGRQVAVLNFARGGYGLLQMISMAAAQAETAKPDLIVVAFITDDLNRGRWWSKSAVIDGRPRELLAARPEDLDNLDKANDTSIVDPRATSEWCEERLQRGDRDAVLTQANEFVESEIERKKLRPNLFALDRSYFYAMLLRRLSGASAPSGFPRIDADSFVRDERYPVDRERLRRAGVPIIFLHLPVEAELSAGRPMLAGAASTIWNTIERDFQTKIATYFDLERKPALPEVHTLEPWDPHPNSAGLKFYADEAFAAIAQRRLLGTLTYTEVAPQRKP
jgi:hypothetical protein